MVQSKVVEKLRSRRVMETKIEAYKRRFRERCEARKLERELGIKDPTWEELYGRDAEPKPFEQFFSGVDPDDPEAYNAAAPGDDFFSSFTVDDSSKWGGYMGGAGAATGG